MCVCVRVRSRRLSLCMCMCVSIPSYVHNTFVVQTKSTLAQAGQSCEDHRNSQFIFYFWPVVVSLPFSTRTQQHARPYVILPSLHNRYVISPTQIRSNRADCRSSNRLCREVSTRSKREATSGRDPLRSEARTNGGEARCGKTPP